MAFPRSLSYVAVTVEPGTQCSSTAPTSNINSSVTRSSRKRWRSAGSVILFTRRIVAESSCCSVDVPILTKVEQTELTGMMEEKNLEVLERRFGGVNGLASLLENHGDIVNRREYFGSNHYKSTDANWSFVLEAAKDPTTIILVVFAALSLGFSVKQHGVKEGLFQGGSVLFAAGMVIGVSVFANLKQSQLCDHDIHVQVLRNGSRVIISANDVVVGDVVCLEPGSLVTADGLFLDGDSLTLDEHSMTGESEGVEVNRTTNPFLFSGTTVTNGIARMLVTSVGMNAKWGEKISSILIASNVNSKTPLQGRTRRLASRIGKVQLVVGILVFVAGATSMGSSKDKMSDADRAARALSASVAIFVVAMPDGVLLAFTLTLDHSVKKMVACGLQVRNLSACENLGSATVICTDMKGVITLKSHEVAQFWIGEEEATRDIDIEPHVVELLRVGVGSTLNPTISGGSTEKAILSWAVSNLHANIDQVREICQVEDFNSGKRVLLKKNGGNEVHIHVKGAPEVILNTCSYFYAKDGTRKYMDEEERNKLKSIVKNMADKKYTCIALAYKRVDQIENQNHPEADLTLLGVLGLDENPCRPGVKDGIESCTHAGVKIILVTGDNLDIAKAVAIKCGILNESGDQLAIQGSDIGILNESGDQLAIQGSDIDLDSTRVMAQSSLWHKANIVSLLKRKGHVVAYIGDSEYALKEADVGISTTTRLQISDIRGDFKSTVEGMKWGRHVLTNLQKLVQFHLTVNASAVLVTLVVACQSGEILLPGAQLAWVNLVSILGTLALGAQRPSDCDTMMERASPLKLITRSTGRNIIGQTMFQVILILSMHLIRRQHKDTLIFNTLVVCQVWSMLNASKVDIFKGNRTLLGMGGVILILQAIMIEFLKKFADTERLHWWEWIACFGLASLSCPLACLVNCIPAAT